jgi:hypothetical protein
LPNSNRLRVLLSRSIYKIRFVAQEAAEELHSPPKGDPPGLNPELILHALRGAEAPLFHGTARI